MWLPTHRGIKGRHTGLSKTMFLLKKHTSGMYDCQMEEETVEHVICNCSSYKLQRGVLNEELKIYNLKELLDVVKIVN